MQQPFMPSRTASCHEKKHIKIKYKYLVELAKEKKVKFVAVSSTVMLQIS
jgi:hypothetical protein